MVVPEELPRYDTVVLLDHPQVLLVEALSEPGLVLGLLEEPWGHVANNVDLQGRGTGIRDALSVSTFGNPPMSSRAGGPPSEWNPKAPLPQTLPGPGLPGPGCSCHLRIGTEPPWSCENTTWSRAFVSNVPQVTWALDHQYRNAE